MWRYWRALPPRGKIGIFMNAWYNELLDGQPAGQDQRRCNFVYMQVINPAREQMLTDEGTVVLKFWIHLSKDEQKTRLRALDRDPQTTWRVTKDDWRAFQPLQQVARRLGSSVLRETSTGDRAVVCGRRRRRALSQLDGRQDFARARSRARSLPTLRHRRAPQRRRAPSVIDNVKLIRDLDLTQETLGRGLRQRPRASTRASSQSCPATSALRIIR